MSDLHVAVMVIVRIAVNMFLMERSLGDKRKLAR